VILYTAAKQAAGFLRGLRVALRVQDRVYDLRTASGSILPVEAIGYAHIYLEPGTEI
jgi:hypothetical protein